ncbi:DUF742 domain-containing protein (plasmid) [Streptomyces sp. NBC_00637]|uniref:DUF742 domain-containing protein n=1 Tax=Streptomyces sp. NBC_00637 TaxID=2903667 RepID=UPI00324A3393
MVPLYVRTDGRLRPREDVRVETVVVAAPGPTETLSVDARRVMRLFADGRGGLAVADISFALHLPPSTVRILVSTLMDSGHLASPAPAHKTGPDTDIIQKVLDGLRQLV